MESKKAAYLNIGEVHGVMSVSHGLEVFDSKEEAVSYASEKSLMLET